MFKSRVFKTAAVISLIGWMILIFALSAENAVESGETSAGFTYKLFTVFYPDFKDMSAVAQQDILVSFSFLVRKTAHFTLYFVLGILSFLNAEAFMICRVSLKALYAWAFSVIYAASDEFHQIFVAGRAGQLRDVAIDSAGALLGILICFTLHKVVENKMHKKTLLKQNLDLFERLNGANARIAALECDLAERDRELENMNEQVLQLRCELALNEQAMQSQAVSEEEVSPDSEIGTLPEVNRISESVAEMSDIINESEETQTEDFEKNRDANLPICDNCIEYGSQIIGKIVVSAAQYSNSLTAGGETRYKELLNLILGKTEVAKSEILDITASEAEFDVKKHMIDSVYEQTVEYFESVMAQI